MSAIAKGLSSVHEVYLVDGGRPVPGHRSIDIENGALRCIQLPRLVRAGDELTSLDGSAASADVLAARVRELESAVTAIRPDLILIDHYPFSKWELELEISSLMDAAQRQNRKVILISSLRDIVGQTRHERVPRAVWEERVLRALAERFHGVLVHADPAFIRLENQLEACQLPVPVRYTGFVVEAIPRELLPDSRPYAVVSSGSAGTFSFLCAVLRAFAQLTDSGELEAMRVLAFGGAFSSPDELGALRSESRPELHEVRPFSSDFARLLPKAVVSVSRAGYNTCVRLLASNVRAVIVPDPKVSDQLERAERLATLGMATALEGDPPAIGDLARAIHETLRTARPGHGFNLAGVEGTLRAVAELASVVPARS